MGLSLLWTYFGFFNQVSPHIALIWMFVSKMLNYSHMADGSHISDHKSHVLDQLNIYVLCIFIGVSWISIKRSLLQMPSVMNMPSCKRSTPHLQTEMELNIWQEHWTGMELKLMCYINYKCFFSYFFFNTTKYNKLNIWIIQFRFFSQNIWGCCPNGPC